MSTRSPSKLASPTAAGWPARIVVGVDFSPESLLAVDHALAIARHRGSAVILAHVGLVPDQLSGIPASMAATAGAWRDVLLARLAEDRAALQQLRDRLAGQGVELSIALHDGFADTSLAIIAHELHADLVVVGTHGRTGFRRLLLGSVAERTVRFADASVLVVRGAAAPGGYRRIVVGTDLSAAARLAIDGARALAAPDAQLRVVHAWAPPSSLLIAEDRMIGQLREELVAATAREASAGGQAIDLVDGSPAEVLDELSASAELVVVGSHGRRGMRRFLIGSVAEATVRHAACSVLIAR